MKMQYLPCFAFLLFLLSCHSEADDTVVPLKPGNGNTTQEEISGQLTWASGFPVVYASPNAVKLEVKLTKPGKVYYIISEKELENPTASLVKDQAMQKPGENATETINGTIEINQSNLKDTTTFLVDSLKPETNYFTYCIAEVNEKDSTSVQSDVKLSESVSYLPSREKKEKYYSDKKGKDISYLFYALEDYYLNPFVKYPLLIFLHGKGEYGNNGDFGFYTNGTIPDLIHKGSDFPFVIVAPQIDTGRWDTDFVDEFIDYALTQYNVDKNRIYMTGNSLGGIGTWEYVGDYPDRLAAIVPISGFGDTTEACGFKNVPVWAFHNQEDGIVDPHGSISMVQALNACEPACPVTPKLTIYPDTGHNAWIRTYDGSAGNDIFAWLLHYSKNP